MKINILLLPGRFRLNPFCKTLSVPCLSERYSFIVDKLQASLIFTAAWCKTNKYENYRNTPDRCTDSYCLQ